MFWKRIMLFGVFCMVTALLLTAVMGNTDLSSLVLEETGLSQGKSLNREYYGETYYMVVKDDDGTASLVLANDRVAVKMKILEKREGEEKQSYPVFLEENEESAEIILEVSSVDVIGLPSNIIDPTRPFIADEECGDIRTFESNEDLRSYLENNTYTPVYYTKNNYQNTSGTVAASSGVLELSMDVSDSDSDGYSVSKDHSSTNIQVAGVDEGDIVKNDGNYAYIISRDDNYKYKVIIADVYPAEEAHIVSQIKVNGTVSEIYITEDRLVIIGAENYNGAFVHVFDIKNKQEPDLLNSYECDGSVTHSRRIGDYLYLIASQSINSRTLEADMSVSPSSIYYFPESDEDNNRYYSLPLTTIISINIANPDEEANSRSIINRYTNNVYVSTGNIYITYRDNQKTVIHRISIKDGDIRYRAMGSAPGNVLNRFSMGEHRGFFRIATSGGSLSKSGQGTATNQVYVLDMDLNTVGKVEDIAPGERIYSARFMGDRAYLVTFKKVDPFFVIDLKNPYNPTILGELKIPGYSDYLHPYDENHVIGLGKDTVEAETGNFAWYQGVKLSLFDVTDVNNPKELSKFIIGDRGTYSPAQNDPHAFLFDKERNLLVIPINLYEIDHVKYPNAADNQQGDYKWSGVYVFDISPEDGFKLKGRITHFDEDEEPTGSYYYWNSQTGKSIKRSFYIDDTLYTCSDSLIKMNGLNDLQDINELPLKD